MYGTTNCGSRGFRGEDSPLMEANDSCGMASLDNTSSIYVGMTVFSHYKSMGAS